MSGNNKTGQSDGEQYYRRARGRSARPRRSRRNPHRTGMTSAGRRVRLTVGTSVMVDRVEMSDGGYVSVHDPRRLYHDDVENSGIGDSFIGLIDYLESGEHTDVEISSSSYSPWALPDEPPTIPTRVASGRVGQYWWSTATLPTRQSSSSVKTVRTPRVPNPKRPPGGPRHRGRALGGRPGRRVRRGQGGGRERSQGLRQVSGPQCL